MYFKLFLFAACISVFSNDLIAGSVTSTAADSVRYRCGLEPDENAPCWINLSTRSQIDGKYVSRTDSQHPYGIGWSAALPGGDGHRSFRVKVTFRVRSPLPVSGLQLVFSVEKEGKAVSWESVDLSSQVTVENDWNTISAVARVIPAAYTSGDHKFSCYVWNPNGITPLDVDDFELVCTQLSPRSFLPAVPTGVAASKPMFSDIYWGPDFSIQYDKVNGACRVLDRSGKVVFDDISLFTQQRTEAVNSAGPKWYGFLLFNGDQLTEEGKAYRFTFRNLSGAELRMIVPRDGHSLSLHFEYKVTEYTVLERQSLMLHAVLPVTAVYTGNGFSTERDFDSEYWLGREGVVWSDSSSHWSVYRPDTVSSLQFDQLNNRLWLNIDYAADHPLLYWPMEAESNNYRIDRSSTVLRPGDRISLHVKINRTEKPVRFPAFTEAPNGREGVFIFTEHADYTMLRSNRAVYFGSDTIAFEKDAVGGFAKYDLPVTKSVFYANPDKVDVSDRVGFANGEIDHVKYTPGFRQFLVDLQANGHEIALHTPDHFTTNRMILNEAFTNMSGSFKFSTWIDHGYDNGRRSNREDVVCDGFVPGSPMYAAGLFREFNVRNVWNCFYEDSALYAEVTYNAELVTPHPAFGHAYPRPVWWRHPSVTGTIRHFRTTCTLAPRDPSMWAYYLSKGRLEYLADHRGVYIAHFYPARLDSVKAFYDWEKPVWSVQPSFDEALRTVAAMRDSGRIWVPTVRDYLDYASVRDAVEYSITSTGDILLTNGTDTAVKGLTMNIKGADISIAGKEIGRRKTGTELFFWFDLGPRESVTVRVVPLP
ncbi:MAG: hypothetical protein RL021_595 [Bacteroidota bacterium]